MLQLLFLYLELLKIFLVPFSYLSFYYLVCHFLIFFFWLSSVTYIAVNGLLYFSYPFPPLAIIHCIIYTLFESYIYCCVYYSCLLVLLLKSYLLYLGWARLIFVHIFHKDNITWVLECLRLFSCSLDTLRAAWLAMLFYIDKYFFCLLKITVIVT